jgi:DNA gyrase subunit B
LYPVKQIGETTKRGTIVTFILIQLFYSNYEYSYDTLSARMRELSFLNKGITITLQIRELDKDGNFVSEIFHSTEGLKNIFVI